jgi:hypothetical protein
MQNEMKAFMALGALTLIACGDSEANGTKCGPGTMLVNEQCVPEIDGSLGDGATSTDGAVAVCSSPSVVQASLIEDFEAGATKWFSYQDGTGMLVTEQWQKYSFSWGQFSQMGFGAQVPFTNRNVLGFNIVFLGTSGGTSFDLWLDNVELLN